jgi:GMP reductase
MRIEEDIKLDYNNVLIRPKRSTLGSRKEVDLERGFKFRNYQGETIDDYRHYRGVPIMASNMDGVGTFDMADTLAKQKIFTCLVKTLQVGELVNYFNADHDFRRGMNGMRMVNSKARSHLKTMFGMETISIGMKMVKK